MATHARAKQAARALKADADQIKKPNEVAQQPARKAHNETLAKHTRESRQEMENLKK